MATIAALSASDAVPHRALMLHAYTHAAEAFNSTPEERAQESEAWWARRIAHPEGLSLACGAFEAGQLAGSGPPVWQTWPSSNSAARPSRPLIEVVGACSHHRSAIPRGFCAAASGFQVARGEELRPIALMREERSRVRPGVLYAWAPRQVRISGVARPPSRPIP